MNNINFVIGYVIVVGAICTFFTFKTQRNKKLLLKIIVTLIVLLAIPPSIWFIVVAHMGWAESLILVGLFLGVGILTMAPHLIDIYSTLKMGSKE